MSSVSRYFSNQVASHGYDDLGFLQTAGVISSVAKWGAGGKWKDMAVITASAPHTVTKGQQVNVTGTTDYDGPVIVLAVLSTTKFVIKKPFTITKTGAWDLKAGDGNWDGIMAVGADIPAANLAITYWNADRFGGNELANPLVQNVWYPLQGIKTIVISTAGNVRLLRAAAYRPGTRRIPGTPVITGYSAASAPVGTEIDILGYNFTQDVGVLIVKFNGVVAYPRISTENKITVAVPAGATTGTITVQVAGGTVSTPGASFTVS